VTNPSDTRQIVKTFADHCLQSLFIERETRKRLPFTIYGALSPVASSDNTSPSGTCVATSRSESTCRATAMTWAPPITTTLLPTHGNALRISLICGKALAGRLFYVMVIV
jgi:hypothetical protein